MVISRPPGGTFNRWLPAAFITKPSPPAHTHQLCAQTQMYTLTLTPLTDVSSVLTTHTPLRWSLFLTCFSHSVQFSVQLTPTFGPGFLSCPPVLFSVSSAPVPSFLHSPLSCSASHRVKTSSPLTWRSVIWGLLWWPPQAQLQPRCCLYAATQWTHAAEHAGSFS